MNQQNYGRRVSYVRPACLDAVKVKPGFDGNPHTTETITVLGVTYHKAWYRYGFKSCQSKMSCNDSSLDPGRPYEVAVDGIIRRFRTSGEQFAAEKNMVRAALGISEAKPIIKSSLDIFYGELEQAIAEKCKRPGFTLSNNLSLHFGTEKVTLNHKTAKNTRTCEVAFWGKMTKKSKIKEFLIGRGLITKTVKS